jgi:hypothetical protein
MVDDPPPNEVRRGFVEAFAKAGFDEGKTVNFLRKTPPASCPTPPWR